MLELEIHAHKRKHADDFRQDDGKWTSGKPSEILSWDDMLDMVVLIDPAGGVLTANASFYRTMGRMRGQGTPLRFTDLVHPPDVPKVERSLIQALHFEKAVSGLEFRIAMQDRIMDVECNAAGVIRDRQLVGYQLVVRDITGRKLLERDHAKAITIIGLAKLAEFRDEDTGAHLERIREYSRILANELSDKPKFKGYIDSGYVEDLFQSSTLHDIGKVGISDRILLKPGKLTEEEFNLIKQHPQLGGDVLSKIDRQVDSRSFLTLGKQIAYYHHEKWNGTGYSSGLMGEAIPLSARIVALADVYDTLTSRRSYKAAFSHEKAGEIIAAERGTHFDPDIADAFLACEGEFNKIRCSMGEASVE